MKNENIDTRFALIAKNGDLLYPYKKNQRKSGRFGFALNAPGEKDRYGKGQYTLDIREVIERVVNDNWNIRVKTLGDLYKREGSMCIGKNAIIGYWISEDLKPIIKNSNLKPLDLAHLNKSNQDHQNSYEDKKEVKIKSGEINENSSSYEDEKNLITDLNHSIEKILSESSELTGEDVDVFAKRRLGQGPFRRMLERRYGIKCFLSEISKRELLIASHIVPWSKSNPTDKVNPDNGLLLAVNWDSVFDKGYVTFGESGEVIFSGEFDDISAETLGINKYARIPEKMMNEGRRSFLKYHREKIFRGTKT